MAIRTGIGVGAAQIADTSGIMNAYARQIAQQQKLQAAQAQREFLSAEKEKERAERAAAKFDEDLADIMASAKLGGIRNIDVEEITKAYNEAKDFYSKAGSLKDSEKPLFRAELRNRMNTINDAAINSKKVEERYYSLASKVAENSSDYDPKVIQDLDYISKTPLSKLGALANMDPITYQKLPNFGLIDNIIDDTYKIGKENAKFAGEVFDKGKRFNVEKVDPALIQNNLVQRFTTSPEALRAISNLYSRELGKQPTNQELTNYIMDKYKTKHGFDYIGEARDLKESKESTDAEKTENVYSNYINKTIAGDTKAMKQLEALGGGNYTLTVSPVDNRFLRITPNKKIKYTSDGGASVEFETDGKSIDINRDGTKLFKYLQKFGIRPSGSKAVSKLKDNTTKKELTWAEKQAKTAASKK
jgi:hypothetical protein